MKKAQTLHDVVVEKYRRGQVMIRFNRGCLLTNYSRISNNPLIKLFHLVVWLYSFPLTIAAALIYFLYFRQFTGLIYYAIGLIILLSLERYVSQKVTIRKALSNRNSFAYLLKKGIITVRDSAEPDSPI
ncbi:MAG: hypothetical protein M0P57_07420 [Syntrophales bacterium]|jgi:hypothetical protein|nr:hypothetical protein [Syntrophales bacterium]MDY0043049.1 hypothetical protein [Syntrophales bacterium]